MASSRSRSPSTSASSSRIILSSRGSGRILTSVSCQVCGDYSSGKHYGIYACDGCAGFFKRSVRRQHKYTCKALANQDSSGTSGEGSGNAVIGSCPIDRNQRNQCRYCRMNTCLKAGMSTDAVQQERGPRKSQQPPAASKSIKMMKPGKSTTVAKQPLPPPPPPPQPPLPMLTPAPSQQQFQQSPQTSSTYSTVMSTGRDELAARLLFLLCKWAAGLPAYRSLGLLDRAILARSSWRTLFLLTAAQARFPALAAGDPRPTTGTSPSDETDAASAMAAAASAVSVLADMMAEFEALQVQPGELACLQGLALFRTVGVSTSASSARTITDLRDQMLTALNSEATSAASASVAATAAAATASTYNRVGRLLLLLQAASSVSPLGLHAAFFRELDSLAALDNLVVDMLLGS